MQKFTFKTITVTVSVLFIATGLGLVHNGKTTIEYLGSAFIGIPAFYLIILLFKKSFSLPEKD